MPSRLTRAERTERNRSLLLAAARRVFLKRGYHGATLEQIAEKAGFSTGVVYSQFDGKADLFLTLLESRIEERAASNMRVAESLGRDSGIERLLEHAASIDRAEPEWGLLVIEFRVHAAREQELGRRYAALHARTVAGMERAIALLCERSGGSPPLPPAELARLVVAVGVGARLEHAVAPDDRLPELFGRLLAGVTADGRGGAIGAASRKRP